MARELVPDALWERVAPKARQNQAAGWRVWAAVFSLLLIGWGCISEDEAILAQSKHAATSLGITHKGTLSTSWDTNVSSFSIPKHPSVANGDLMLAFIGVGASANTTLPTITAPSGWTLINHVAQGTANDLRVYRKVANNETASSYTWTANDTLRGVGWISVYSGVDTSAPIHNSVFQLSGTAGTAYQTGSINTTTPCVLVGGILGYGWNGSNGSTWTVSGTGRDERADENNGTSRSGVGGDFAQTASGSSGTFAATASATQDYALTALIALKPATGAVQVTFRATQQTTWASGSTNTFTMQRPASTVAGDLLLATLHVGSSGATVAPTITPPSGWTLVERVDRGLDGTLITFRHFAASGGTNSYTFTSNISGLGGVGWISAYANVDPTNPINVTSDKDMNTSGTAYTAPTVTTTAASLIVANYAGYRGAGGTTWTLGNGLTTRLTVNNGGSRSGATGELHQTTSGNTTAYTGTASASQTWALSTVIALRPRGGICCGPPPDPSTFLYWETFEDGKFDGVVLQCANQNGVPSYPRFSYVTSPVWERTKAFKYELQDASTEPPCSERAEVLFDDALSGTGSQDRWFAFSAYWPSHGQETDSESEIFHQAHQTSQTSPPLSLGIQNGRIWAEINEQVFCGYYGCKGTTDRRDLGPVPKDQWVRFVIHYRFRDNDNADNGIFKVWMNGTLTAMNVTDKKTIYRWVDDMPVFKLGIYKWPWDLSGTSDVSLRIMYIDDVRVGNGNATFNDMNGPL